jgi:hypothetical protein
MSQTLIPFDALKAKGHYAQQSSDLAPREDWQVSKARFRFCRPACVGRVRDRRNDQRADCRPTTGGRSLNPATRQPKYKESNMPLDLIVENLDNVPTEMRENYVKQRDGKYQLDLRDSKPYVESQLKPLKSDLEITRAHERKLLVENGLGSPAARKHSPGIVELVIANLRDQVAIDTLDNKRVVRIAQAEGGMPLVGSGEGGAATLDDLVKQAVERFPSMFEAGGKPASTAKDNAGGSGPKTMKRAAFDALSPIDRAAKMKEGFTLTDPLVTKPENRKLGAKQMLRSDFDQLGARERATKMKEGFTLVQSSAATRFI